MMNLLVLGSKSAAISLFPTYETLSIIKIGEVFQRIEILAATGFIIAVFLKLSILLLAACKGISKILNLKDYRTIVFPVALMICNFSYFSFVNVAIFHDWTFKVFPYYSSIFEIIIPIIILITIEIKIRIKNKSHSL